MRVERLFRKVLGFARTIVKAVRFLGEEEAIEIEVKASGRKPRCGSCGKRAMRLHGTQGKQRRWRHLGLWGREVVLVARVWRVLCRRCGVRTMEVPWARTGSVFTRTFENEVAWFLQRTDQTTVAGYFGISWAAAGRIARRVVAEALDGSRLDGLEFIGVDEIHYGRPQKFLTVVTDHVSGRVVWAGEGGSSVTLGRFFEELGPERTARIKVVTMDMDAAYEKAVREQAPAALIVYDRFHVVQLVNRALDEQRREEVRKASPEEKKAIKSSRWPLLKNPWNLHRSEEQKLSEIQRNNQRLYRGYLLKESFLDIYDAPTPEIADERFDEWFPWARRSRLEPFKKLANTLATHWQGIRRFIEFKLTNALAEGSNSKIRMISHRAFGFHSAAALIAMIYLDCSQVSIPFVGW